MRCVGLLMLVSSTLAARNLAQAQNGTLAPVQNKTLAHNESLIPDQNDKTRVRNDSLATVQDETPKKQDNVPTRGQDDEPKQPNKEPEERQEEPQQPDEEPQQLDKQPQQPDNNPLLGDEVEVSPPPGLTSKQFKFWNLQQLLKKKKRDARKRLLDSLPPDYAGIAPINDVWVLGSLVRYAYFASAAHSKDCFTPPLNTTVEQTWVNYQAGSKAVLFRDDVAMEYVAAFAGADKEFGLSDNEPSSMQDCKWAVGDSCKDCQCHKSFIEQYVPIRQNIMVYLSSVKSAGYPIVFTGHGTGGALASLAATDFRARRVSPTVASAAFTYGQPRVGNGYYAEFVDGVFQYDGAMFRATHGTDYLVRVPDSSEAHKGGKKRDAAVVKREDYRHHGNEVWNAPLSMPVFWCPGAENPACALNGWVGSRGDHSEYFGVKLGGEPEGDIACGHKP